VDRNPGFWMVIAGLVTILVALWFVVGKFTTAADVTAVLGPITTAIAGLVGAFFGVNLGQQGKAEADKQRDLAQKRAEFYSAHLDPARKDEVVEKAQLLA